MPEVVYFFSHNALALHVIFSLLLVGLTFLTYFVKLYSEKIFTYFLILYGVLLYIFCIILYPNAIGEFGTGSFVEYLKLNGTFLCYALFLTIVCVNMEEVFMYGFRHRMLSLFRSLLLLIPNLTTEIAFKKVKYRNKLAAKIETIPYTKIYSKSLSRQKKLKSTLADKIERYLHNIEAKVVNSGSNRINTFNISRDGEAVFLTINGYKRQWYGSPISHNIHLKVSPQSEGDLYVEDTTYFITESYSISVRKFRKKIRSLVFDYLEE